MNPEKVGKQIATLRKKQGLTQKDLAALLHVTDKAVSKWERGLNFPELALMEPLAAALNTTVIYLLSLENSSNQEVVDTLSTISIQEKQKLVRALKTRAILKIINELILLGALIWASKLFADNDIYGLAQILTLGMTGLIGTLIGSELYSIKHLPTLY